MVGKSVFKTTPYFFRSKPWYRRAPEHWHCLMRAGSKPANLEGGPRCEKDCRVLVVLSLSVLLLSSGNFCCPALVAVVLLAPFCFRLDAAFPISYLSFSCLLDTAMRRRRRGREDNNPRHSQGSTNTHQRRGLADHSHNVSRLITVNEV